jgi:hypothetical protein
MFTPKVIMSSKELPEGWFAFTNVKTFDGVALFIDEFKIKHGEPVEGYVWKVSEGFIHVYLRNERIEK